MKKKHQVNSILGFLWTRRKNLVIHLTKLEHYSQLEPLSCLISSCFCVSFASQKALNGLWHSSPSPFCVFGKAALLHEHLQSETPQIVIVGPSKAGQPTTEIFILFNWREFKIHHVNASSKHQQGIQSENSNFITYSIITQIPYCSFEIDLATSLTTFPGKWVK